MYTGMRISEVTGLHWNNVFLDKKIIRVEESLSQLTDRKNKKIYYKMKSPKTEESYREIPLPDHAIEVLKYFEKYKTKENDFVCVNENGGHYTRKLIETTLRRIVNNSECKEKGYTPHGLRHGYGSILISKKVDIKTVSQLLGHTDVNFTYNVYIDIFKEDKSDAVFDVFNKKQKNK